MALLERLVLLPFAILKRVSLRIETFTAGPLSNNIYLLTDDDAHETVIIDPSIDSEIALAAVQANPSSPLQAIWNTHGHFDHIYDNAKWKHLFKVPLIAHAGDEYFLENLGDMSVWFGLPVPESVAPDVLLENDQIIRVGRHEARVLYTPGHSPGSVSFYLAEAGVCISGDVLFRGSVGRTDLPGCSTAALNESLRLLATLPSTTRILPGHGLATTLGEELQTNPFYHELQASPENSI
jgi:glyoxylase-like metal-dependent hydrolase (beta-lactamase superfamily II)